MKGHGDFSIGSAVWPGISKLVEECGEVTQVAGKLLGAHGERAHRDGSDLKTRLEFELGDLMGAVGFVIKHCGLDEAVVCAQATKKERLFEQWHGEQVPLPVPEPPAEMETASQPCESFIGTWLGKRGSGPTPKAADAPRNSQCPRCDEAACMCGWEVCDNCNWSREKHPPAPSLPPSEDDDAQ